MYRGLYLNEILERHAKRNPAFPPNRDSFIKEEFSTKEPNLIVEIIEIASPEKVMELGVQEGLIKSIYAAHNGVYRMSPDILI